MGIDVLMKKIYIYKVSSQHELTLAYINYSELYQALPPTCELLTLHHKEIFVQFLAHQMKSPTIILLEELIRNGHFTERAHPSDRHNEH